MTPQTPASCHPSPQQEGASGLQPPLPSHQSVLSLWSEIQCVFDTEGREAEEMWISCSHQEGARRAAFSHYRLIHP